MDDKVGRPTVITDSLLAKLVEDFKQGFNDEQACKYGQIHTVTFYRHMKNDEDFARKIESAKTFITIKAAKVAVNAIKKGNVQIAKWWLEKKQPDELGDPKQV